MANDNFVVITKAEYKKGMQWFNKVSDVKWIISESNEEEVARQIEEHKAKIVVLGVEKYSKILYSAVSKNGKPGLIIRYGVGYDGIALELCRQNGIFLANTPNVLDQSVAENVFALLLNLARNIVHTNKEFVRGMFISRTGFELNNKLIGIAGFGNIGKKVSKMACRGFGMKVYAFDTYPLKVQAEKLKMSPEKFMKEYCLEKYFVNYEEFVKDIDIISIHLPSNKNTFHFFNEKNLSKLKRGTILINTSRGNLVDEIALYKLLVSNHLRSAALDVFKSEPYIPAEPEYDLRKLPNVLLTPHISSNTFESNERITKKVIENIKYFLDNKYELLTRII